MPAHALIIHCPPAAAAPGSGNSSYQPFDSRLPHTAPRIQARISLQPFWNQINVEKESFWLALWGTCGGARALSLACACTRVHQGGPLAGARAQTREQTSRGMSAVRGGLLNVGVRGRCDMGIKGDATHTPACHTQQSSLRHCTLPFPRLSTRC